MLPSILKPQQLIRYNLIRIGPKRYVRYIADKRINKINNKSKDDIKLSSNS
ncbi:hypothetical protein ACIJYD_04315 [Candidatus Pelagibacter bacterium nBUS_33]|jgi:hypothetical protein|uniref:hypothetical protein n=1 Tax=Candidatus Pelagibacter bacterium nBUS_33 TaxID=3374193 RepID=UPI003EBF340E